MLAYVNREKENLMLKSKIAIELSKEIITSPSRNFDGHNPSTCAILIAAKAAQYVSTGEMPVSDARQLLELAKTYR